MMSKRIIQRIKSKIIPSYNSPLRIYNEKKIVFIHINKTGGTSMGKALGLPLKRHLTVDEVINIIGEEGDGAI